MTVVALRKWMGAPLLHALVWAAIAAAVSALVRYGVVELEYFRRVCGDDTALPAWCWPRQILIMVIDWWVPGVVTVVCGLYALMRPERQAVAAAAVILGAIGVALYNAGPASVGLVLGLATLARERV
ncbi:MAG: hypothetical protein ACM30I_12530 [Gemmatimonas sp.]